MQVLLWKSNFDENPQSVDVTSNKYANNNNHMTTPHNPSAHQEQSEFQMISLEEKVQSESSNERWARKVNILKETAL